MNPSRIPFLLVVFLALGCGDAPGGGTPATSDAGLADALTPGDLFYVDSTQPADLVVAPDVSLVSDTSIPVIDSVVPVDLPLDLKPDQSLLADLAPLADTAPQLLNCNGIGICSEDCGKTCPAGLAKFGCLIKCSDDCKAEGCASAQTLFTPLRACIQSKCLVDCLGGPGTTCTNCTVTKCAAETTACNAHSC